MKSKVRSEIFFVFMTFFIILCLSIIPSSAQYSPGYGMYGSPYGYGAGYSNWSGYPNYGGYTPYGAPYGGYQPEYYPNYGYSQPYNYQPSGYVPNYYNYGQPNYGGYYPNYGYSQSQYYGGYPSPYRQPSYNQPYNYGGGIYTGYSPIRENPYLQVSSIPSAQPYFDMYGGYQQQGYQIYYEDADEEIDEDDDGEDITLEEGETLSIILKSMKSQGYEWILDTDELDTDIVKKVSDEFFPLPEGSAHIGYISYIPGLIEGVEQWIFKARNPGTTTICLEYLDPYDDRVRDFEIEVTVEED